MSARALKRRRLEADSLEADSGAAPTSGTKIAEQKTQDARLVDSVRASLPRIKSSPAVKHIPTPSRSLPTQIKSGQDAAVSDTQPSPAPRTAMEIWREAKSKSQGYRRRMMKEQTKEKAAIDVYDDFEGAHVEVEPHRRIVKAVEKEKRVASGKGSGKGKKTHGRAPDKEPAQPNANVETPRKRTFEDEIRELEETAKKRAEDEENEVSDDDDEIAVSHVSERRSSSRKSKPSERMQLLVNGSAASASSAKRAIKPLDRRKTKATVQSEDEIGPLRNGDTNHEGTSETPEIVMIDATPEAIIPLSTSIEHKLRAKSAGVSGIVERTRDPPSKLSPAHFSPEDMQLIRKVVLEKATGKRPIPLVHLDTELAKISAIVNQTITAGESNSVLLIGARGCGKSALVKQVIREQMAQHPDDFHVVRLSGFIHTDDKIALREIWRQLGREMDPEDDSTMKNYADILTSLLALLSHPAETGRDREGHITKSVIFIIDEFELFANHPRQTLLYNLFDIAQSRKAPIAVLGLTTKIDVAESLEKRVKSRFSHRYVHLSLAKSFQAYEETCKTALAIAASELTEVEKSQLRVATGISDKFQKTSSKEDDYQPAASLTEWNQLVDHIFALDSVERHLRRLYYTTKSVPQFLTSISYPMATIPTRTSPVAADLLAHFETTFTPSLGPPDSKLGLLPSLSMLQLGLLVCAARLTAIHDADTVSFALAYDEYKALASKVKIQASASGALAQGAGSRVWGRGVAKNAWEALVDCGLVLPDGRAGGAGRVDVGLEEIGMSGVELGLWGRWCREI